MLSEVHNESELNQVCSLQVDVLLKIMKLSGP